MRAKAAIACALLVFSVSCERGSAVRFTGCALADGKLSVAFSDPAKAKSYLTHLAKRLRDGDSDAAEEAADLVSRVARCADTEKS